MKAVLRRKADFEEISKAIPRFEKTTSRDEFFLRILIDKSSSRKKKIKDKCA